MHRAYQSLKPSGNRLLKQRWDNIYYQQHREKVATVKSSIDNKPPPTYMHLHCNVSKLQVAEERMAKVERDNRILMEKMAHCFRTKGGLDNENHYERRSLNMLKRRRELLKLTLENQAMLRRLIAKRGHYHHKEWEEEWKVNLKYMANSAKYPLYFLSPQERKKLAKSGGAVF